MWHDRKCLNVTFSALETKRTDKIWNSIPALVPRRICFKVSWLNVQHSWTEIWQNLASSVTVCERWSPGLLSSCIPAWESATVLNWESGYLLDQLESETQTIYTPSGDTINIAIKVGVWTKFIQWLCVVSYFPSNYRLSRKQLFRASTPHPKIWLKHTQHKLKCTYIYDKYMGVKKKGGKQA